MQPPDEDRHRPEGFIGLSPVREGREGNVARNEPHAFAAIRLDSNRGRSTVESHGLKLRQENRDRDRVLVGWPKDVRARANDGAGIGHATTEHLLVSVHETSPSQEAEGIDDFMPSMCQSGTLSEHRDRTTTASARPRQIGISA